MNNPMHASQVSSKWLIARVRWVTSDVIRFLEVRFRLGVVRRPLVPLVARLPWTVATGHE